MTKQRTATAIGAAVGLVLGFIVFNDEGSVLATLPLAVLFAIVAGSIGFYAARSTRERR